MQFLIIVMRCHREGCLNHYCWIVPHGLDRHSASHVISTPKRTIKHLRIIARIIGITGPSISIKTRFLFVWVIVFRTRSIDNFNVPLARYSQLQFDWQSFEDNQFDWFIHVESYMVLYQLKE